VFVDTPLADCMRRDPKGLYAKAREGKLANFTGVDAPYEAPVQPELHLHTAEQSAEQSADAVVRWLVARGVVRSA